jgi:2-C-methyl-D-erythritol 4-phosphate cytidylyltransferase/2-C-methyl-D-erythritol 2,4-cyclodiphosphate synthase
MGAPVNKVLLPLEGRPVLWHAVRAFCRSPFVDGVCVVAAPEERGAVQEAVAGLDKVADVICGGATRQQSVLRGLRALPEGAKYVMVHDGARPLVGQRLIEDCARTLLARGSAVACAPVFDTIKRAREGRVLETVDRAQLAAVHTPQCFAVQALIEAYERAEREGTQLTDDASAIEAAGGEVCLVESRENNLKLTTPDDLILAGALLRQRAGAARMPRTGFGYDVHRLVPGRRLVLCGVEIPSDLGLAGHSDADVAVHALIDALLGAACLGDIGRLYPDDDPAYEGIDSMLLLKDVVCSLDGFEIVHADVTIVAQKPKLAPHMARMVESLSLALPGTHVNVKATTTERLGFEGRGEGISAQAVATIW